MMMALRKQQQQQQLSPAVSLNNKGVLLLEKGQYRDAARYFARASKITISAMTIVEKQTAAAARRKNETNNSSASTQVIVEDEPSRKKCLSPTTTQRSNTVSPSSSWSRPRRREPSSCGGGEPPRKRSNAVMAEAITTTTLCVPPPTAVQQRHSLGRPLWIQSRRKVDPLSFSATLMYNLALSFHLMAIQKEQKQNQQEAARPMYQKALDLYVLSLKSMMRRAPTTTSRTAQQSPILVVVLHNASLVCHVMQDYVKAARYQSQLAHHLVRQLCCTNHGKQYEAFYIRLLWLFQSTNAAGAA